MHDGPTAARKRVPRLIGVRVWRLAAAVPDGFSLFARSPVVSTLILPFILSLSPSLTSPHISQKLKKHPHLFCNRTRQIDNMVCT